MKILGINYLSESSVSYMDNGLLKYAVSEERINRKKNWYGDPIKTLQECINENKIKLKDLDVVSTHGTSSVSKSAAKNLNYKDYKSAIEEIKLSSLNNSYKKFLIKKLVYRRKKEELAYLRNSKIIKNFQKKYKKKLEIFDHHTCHAASAAYYSGWNNCLVLTIDGYGDTSSSKLFKFQKNKLRELKNTSILHSLGYFYGSITNFLGFKPQRHEGKVLGLAAFGNSKKAYKVISKLISYDKKNKNFKGGFANGFLPMFKNDYLKKILKNYKKEDIAAATQERLENVVISYLKDLKFKKFKLAVAGGVFSNVKLNQKISEIKKVSDIYVFQNMGDGGLSAGAVALSHVKRSKTKICRLENVYLGKNFKDIDIKKYFKFYDLKYMHGKSLDRYVAKELHKGKIIALFNNRMEFGPRSLGNRSILSRATDIKINKVLNKKLNRTEFMPFAPITLSKKKKEMYINSNIGRHTSKFMTITYKCSKKMKKISPAVVHVDGTARPQIVEFKNNPKLYNILNEYYKISGIPNLINTSFNLHEEPIVYSPRDALKTFKKSKLDYLYIGNYLLYR